MIAGVVLAATKFYDDHGPLVLAMLLADEAINQRVRGNLKATANKFVELLGQRGVAMTNELGEAVSASCSIVIGAMHSDLLIDSLPPARPVHNALIVQDNDRPNDYAGHFHNSVLQRELKGATCSQKQTTLMRK